ncbi:hypothetical protein [Niabella ginsenosidivorans]|nr:hypothetical protein [Niabella ginsenosidivorans]
MAFPKSFPVSGNEAPGAGMCMLAGPLVLVHFANDAFDPKGNCRIVEKW